MRHAYGTMFWGVRWNRERIWERRGLLYSKHDGLKAENIGIKYNKRVLEAKWMSVLERNVERRLVRLMKPARGQSFTRGESHKTPL